MISIHAPAWGATHSLSYLPVALYVFQSTLPHGERPGRTPWNNQWDNFNPRSRMGSDGVSGFQPAVLF